MLQDEHDYLPLFQSPFEAQDASPRDDLENGPQPHGHHHIEHTESRHTDPDSPTFRRYHQATNSELFYDLFFVANLTSFTYVHDINDSNSTRQYVGFFCILWFTWYQVSLYDVRFSMDSVLERVAKAVQFLIMMGFAIVGPQFNPGEPMSGDNNKDIPNFEYFRGLTIILMISRIVLGLQYLQAMWFAKSYKKMVVPMSLLAVTYFLAAIVYLGLFWSFDPGLGENHSYYAWYIVGITETILATGVSVVWKNVSFVETHLVERMNLLTLIILGEGAITIAKACQHIATSQGVFRFSMSVGAWIACSVFNVYFMYMIYFDWLHEELFGSIRQQIWSFLHFPLHVAMILALEGQSQAITWNAAVRKSDGFKILAESWRDVVYSNTSTAADFEQVALSVNSTANDLIAKQLEVSSKLLSTYQGAAYLYQDRASVVPAIMNGTKDHTAAVNALWYIVGGIYSSIFKIARFYPPKTLDHQQDVEKYISGPLNFSDSSVNYQQDAIDLIDEYYKVFSLVYTYFFVSMGIFVILCAVLAAVNRGRHTRVFWVRLVMMALIGGGLVFMSTLASSNSALNAFVLSPWILPTVTGSLFVIVVIHSVPAPKCIRERNRKKRQRAQVEGEEQKQ